MNLRLAFLALLTLALFSCDKNDENTPCPPTGTTNPDGSGSGGAGSSFEYVSSVGSYWIYEWYQVFYDGSEVLTDRVDSVYISGDTLINGREYFVRKGTWFPSNTVRTTFERDSLGYVVGIGNKLRWSYIDFSDTLFIGSILPLWNFTVSMTDQQLALTPAGPFISVQRQQEISLISGEPVNICGDQVFTFSTYYASGVGRVIEQTGYFGPIEQCNYYQEARLIRYNIAI